MSPTSLSRASAIVAVAVMFATMSVAQVQTEWQRYHDGPAGLGAVGMRGVVAPTGEVYVAGHVVATISYSRDAGLVKYSASGVELWSAEHDFGHDDVVYALALAPNGDAYVGGSSYGSSPDVGELVKFDVAGTFQWANSLPGVVIAAMECDAQGNAICCGWQDNATTHSDAYVASFSPSGAPNWTLVIDGGVGGRDGAISMRVLANGEVIAAGWTRSTSGRGDLTVWRISPSGQVIWTSAVDGGFHLSDAAYCVAVSDAGKVAAAGYRYSSTTDSDWMLAQFDLATGALEWTAFNPSNLTEYIASVAIDRDGVVWTFGQHDLANGFDFTVERHAPSGALLSSTPWVVTPAPAVPFAFNVGLTLGSAGQAWATVTAALPWLNTFIETTVVRQFDSSGGLDWERAIPDTFSYSVALAPQDRMVLAGPGRDPITGFQLFATTQLDLRDSPQAYCIAKTTSNGCEPVVTFTGMPSASASSGFVVRAERLRNNKNGILLYGVNGSASAPFLGGTLCVAAPSIRTTVQSSNGSALPADDCSGAFQLDMNAYAAGALGGSPLAVLQSPGTAVFCQFWGRDPGFAPPNNAMLSNALRYVVLP